MTAMQSPIRAISVPVFGPNFSFYSPDIRRTPTPPYPNGAIFLLAYFP
jgi:hypothetical protein